MNEQFDRILEHMHHKYAIFDKSTLVTGSYNWTRSAADCNEENIVVQYDRSLIRRFNEKFEELWDSFGSM